MRTLAVLLLMLGLAVPAVADDKPDAEKPVSIDFVKKSLKAVVEWCAAKAGTQVEFSENFKDAEVTVSIKDRKPLDIAQAACKQHGYEIAVDDRAWRVTKVAAADPGKAIEEAVSGRFRAEFVNTGHIDAIMTVAKASKTIVSVPTLSPEELEGTGEKRIVGPGKQVPINLNVRHATPDYLLREIARQAAMTIEFDPETGGYDFAYKK